MPHFLQYWKTYNPEKEVGTPLDFAASAQFNRVKPGDTLWIVALRQHRLTLLGRLVDLGSKLVFLLRHGFEKKHQPILPILLFLTDDLRGATQREVAVVQEGTTEWPPVPRSQRKERSMAN
ncbi:MAG: hypothetical protein WB660_10555 [Candidatus Sulfotelmatobacter sp.]